MSRRQYIDSSLFSMPLQIPMHQEEMPFQSEHMNVLLQMLNDIMNTNFEDMPTDHVIHIKRIVKNHIDTIMRFPRYFIIEDFSILYTYRQHCQLLEICQNYLDNYCLFAYER